MRRDLTEAAERLARQGYSLATAALILRASASTLRATGCKFGKRRLPDKWVLDLGWKSRVIEKQSMLEDQFKKFLHVAAASPCAPASYFEGAMQGLAPDQLSKWLLGHSRELRVRGQIMALMDREDKRG